MLASCQELRDMLNGGRLPRLALVLVVNVVLSRAFFVQNVCTIKRIAHSNKIYEKNGRKTVVLKSASLDDLGSSIRSVSRGESWYASHIVSIKAYNLAGVVNQGVDNVIAIEFGDCPNLVAVTGETGSGKSLLVAKLADLVTGGKATAALLPTSGEDKVAIIEMGKCC